MKVLYDTGIPSRGRLAGLDLDWVTKLPAGVEVLVK
jgi:hypothetical protein